jgi:hypothetical protein
LKIATNMIAACNIQVLAEALALVKKTGLDPQTLTRALEHHGARSALIDMKLPKLIAGDYEPHFSLQNMLKDARIAIRMADELGLDLPATATTAGVMTGAVERGWQGDDFSVVGRLFDKMENEPADEILPPPNDSNDPLAPSNCKPLGLAASDAPPPHSDEVKPAKATKPFNHLRRFFSRSTNG